MGGCVCVVCLGALVFLVQEATFASGAIRHSETDTPASR